MIIDAVGSMRCDCKQHSPARRRCPPTCHIARPYVSVNHSIPDWIFRSNFFFFRSFVKTPHALSTRYQRGGGGGGWRNANQSRCLLVISRSVHRRPPSHSRQCLRRWRSCSPPQNCVKKNGVRLSFALLTRVDMQQRMASSNRQRRQVDTELRTQSSFVLCSL
jgi:hypothetical protein